METWSKYYKVKDSANRSGVVIRRYKKVDGKVVWDRFPAKDYAHLSQDEIDKLLNRLNASFVSQENIAKERYKFDHAYLNPLVMEAYEKELNSCMERPQVVTNLTWLNCYGFEFFVLKLKISDPSLWYKKSADWGEWLQGKFKDEKGRPYTLSISTIIQVVQSVNKFLTFLSDKQFYEEMGAIRLLKPLGRAKIKTLKANTIQATDKPYLSMEIFNKICKENPDNRVLPNLKLQRKYGLRIAETLGSKKDKFRKGYLIVDEQGAGVKLGKIVTKPVKTRELRKVPHWFADPKEMRDQIDLIIPMHPSTLKEEMNDLLAKYGFTSHDNRAAWITDALDEHKPSEVQLAAGHKDIRTTMGYKRDKRNLDDDVLD